MKTTITTIKICVALMALISIEINAQDPTWSWVIDSDGIESEFSGRIAAGQDETIYAHVLFNGSFSLGDVEVEFPPSLSPGTLYPGLAKFTGSGDPEWVISFADPDLGYNLSVRGLATDGENNVYISGTLSRLNAEGDFQVNIAGLNFVVPGSASNDGYVAKIDPEGNGLWVRNLSTEDTPATGLQTPEVAVDENDNVYFAGTFSSTIEIDETLHESMGLMDLFLTCLNTEGEILWSTSMGSTENDYFAYINPAVGGGLLMSSMWSNETVYVGGLEVSNPDAMIGINFDRWIAKINDEGSAEWLVREGGPGNQLAGKPVSTPTGGAMVVSLIGTSSTILNGETYDQSGYLVTRYSSSGELEQVSHYPATTGNVSISSDGNDHYFLGFEFSTPTASFGDFQFVNNGGLNQTNDLLVAAVDGNGLPLWATSVGSVEHESLRGLAFSQSHGLVVGGSFASSTLTFDDILLENNGFFTADLFVGALDFISSVTNATGVQSLLVYPNPAQEHFTVDLTILSAQQHTLRIFDTRGSLVQSQTVSGASIQTIEVGNLPKGHYLVLIQAGSTLYSSKLIKL